MMKRILAKGGMIPVIAGEFVPIYVPQGDVFPGPDSKTLKAGQWYDSWVPNDHSFIRGPDGFWHGFGCTDPADEAYWLAFHIVSPAGTLRESMRPAAWKESAKVLTPAERPGERREVYAPFVIERSGMYYMFYGPTDIRVAVSKDLFHWKPLLTCFTHNEGCARDPHVSLINGVYHLVYMAGCSVFLRTSPDLLSWPDPSVEIFRLKGRGVPESPLLIEYDGLFYLFWTIWDKSCSYDNRTFVFRSDRPDNFQNADELPQIAAHAPELMQDNDGQWYITSAERPYRGISMAKLEWKKTGV